MASEQISAQSMLSRMHRDSIFTSSSSRQAAVQWLHSSAHL
jgi:hypothetical protein